MNESVLPSKCLCIHGLDGCETYKIDDHTIGVRPKWIKVEDKLPEIGKVVLLYQTYPPGSRFKCLAYPLQINFTEIGGLNHRGIFISKNDQFSDVGLKYVSHWMPLPQPPEDKNGMD